MERGFQELLEKYNQGIASAEERKMVEGWYLSLGKDTGSADYGNIDLIFVEGKENIRRQYLTPAINHSGLWKKVGIAAAILLFLGGYLAIQLRYSSSGADTTIVPGQQVAMLLLDDGSEVDLRHLAQGTVLVENGMEVTKLEEGRIAIAHLYAAQGERKEHLIRTPVGGEYEIALPDGSVVKLNAASELRFYSDYNTADRKVRLSGEAYFDIHKSTVPFVVYSATQTVEVLGTAFNIKAYPDELETVTRLLRGSVKVSGTGSAGEIILKPGEQLVQVGSEMTVSSEENPRVDWVHQEISFEAKSIDMIMNEIARWYDIEVVFENPEIKAITYTGTISRYTDFQDVLTILEKTGTLKFEINGRKISVR